MGRLFGPPGPVSLESLGTWSTTYRPVTNCAGGVILLLELNRTGSWPHIPNPLTTFLLNVNSAHDLNVKYSPSGPSL
jgi:hypothetical protein